jgi:signal transduction histidine kinase/CheY-like chemotaxis protein
MKIYELKKIKHPQICPVTGLPIKFKTNWLYNCENSAVYFGLLDSQIILSSDFGYSSQKDIGYHLHILESIIDNEIPHNTGFVLIENVNHLEGISIRARRDYILKLRSTKNLIGIIFINADALMKTSIFLGKTLKKVHFKVRFHDTYFDAISESYKLLGRKAPKNSGFNQSIATTIQKHEKCTYTGLPIHTKPEWTNIKLSETYGATFKIIGEKILHSKIYGSAGENGVIEFFRARKQVLEEALLWDSKIVEIIDFASVKGGLSKTARLQFADSIKALEGSLLGQFVFNTSWMVKSIVNFSRNFFNPSFPIAVVDTYDEAIHKAYSIVVEKSLQQSIIRYSRPDLKIQVGDATCTCEIINREVINIIIEGSLSPKAFKPIEELISRTIDELLSVSPIQHYRIFDFTKIKNFSIRNGKDLIKITKNLSIKYPVTLGIIVGDTFFSSTSMRFARKFIKYEVVGTTSTEKALQLIREHKINNNLDFSVEMENENPTIIHELLQLLGSISWDEVGQVHFENIDDTHPLREIYDAITIIKSDIGDMLEERNERERDLQKLKLLAEDSDKAKSEFLANMSHEIRTPMNGVLGMITLLMETSLTEDQKKYTHIVKESADSLLRIINDILDISKIDANKFELIYSEFNFRDLIEDITNTFSLNAAQKGLEFICYIDNSIPNVLHGDPVRIRQILTNLIGNAIKFTDSGQVVVQSVLLNSWNDKSKINFSVQDTGIGIPTDKQDLLYKKFSQTDGSMTRKYGGTGLGLHITKRLVELMDGTVDFKSEEDKGSEFSFSLSMKHSIPQENPVQSTQLDNIKILFVDKNDTTLKITKKMFSSLNINFSLCKTGTEAKKLLVMAQKNGSPFDIIFIDANIIKTTATTLVKSIKKNPKLNKTHCILMKNILGSFDWKVLQKLGFTSYITKPLHQRDFCNSIKWANNKDLNNKQIQKPTQKNPSSPSIIKTREDIRILIVEDTIINQKVAQAILKKLGYRADTVSNGNEALTVMRVLPYDLVLMDMQMPIMDGITATKTIRNSTMACKNTPIIAMTANAMESDKETCMTAGMNDYISKPISSTILESILIKWL